MELVEIAHRNVIVELDPEEALMLARACEAACLMTSGSDAQHVFPENDQSLSYIFENAVCLFEAAALAASVEDVSYQIAKENTLSNQRRGRTSLGRGTAP